MKKICTKCKQDKETSLFWAQRGTPDGLRYWCKKCMNKDVEKYKKNRDRQSPARVASNRRRAKTYYQSNPIKVNARNVTRAALKNGELTLEMRCAMKDIACGGRLEVHHKDYNFPLEVMVLCKRHHKEITYP